MSEYCGYAIYLQKYSEYCSFIFYNLCTHMQYIYIYIYIYKNKYTHTHTQTWADHLGIYIYK